MGTVGHSLKVPMGWLVVDKMSSTDDETLCDAASILSDYKGIIVCNGFKSYRCRDVGF